MSRGTPDLSRREAIELLGVAGASVLVGCGSGHSGPDGTGVDAGVGVDAGTGLDAAVDAGLDASLDAATDAGALDCVVRPDQIEGPYFVDEGLQRSDIRANPTTGVLREGVPLRLAFSVHRVEDGLCSPLAGAQVDLWHCDALGVYSDVSAQDTVGDKALRGFQRTDDDGAVEFTTIYPGWYGGRAIHLHIKVRTFADALTTYEFTSQLYFDDAISDEVMREEPYVIRGPRDTRNTQDSFFEGPSRDRTIPAPSGEELLLRLTPDGDGYRGEFSIGLAIT